MKTHADVLKLLTTRFERNHRAWLTGAQCTAPLALPTKDDVVDTLDASNGWPMSVPLGNPTEKDVVKNVDTVRNWARSWRAWNRGGLVSWKDKQWRLVGKQSIPVSLTLVSPEELAAVTGLSTRWSLEKGRYGAITARWPTLSELAAKYINTLVEYSSEDFNRLILVLSWLEKNPGAYVFPRQLPIAGVDTKWIETRVAMVANMLCTVRGVSTSGNPYTDCGLRELPPTVNLRLLDPVLRERFDGLTDSTSPVEQVAKLTIKPDRVLIIENKQTALALPDMPGTVVIMALGYRVDCLGALPWLHGENTEVWYWGDLDTHGFSILHRARQYVPKMRSFLMDKTTLLSHKELWVYEDTPALAPVLTNLTQEEHNLYTELQSDVYGEHVRFEQERVSWQMTLDTLAKIIGD